MVMSKIAADMVACPTDTPAEFWSLWEDVGEAPTSWMDYAVRRRVYKNVVHAPDQTLLARRGRLRLTAGLGVTVEHLAGPHWTHRVGCSAGTNVRKFSGSQTARWSI